MYFDICYFVYTFNPFLADDILVTMKPSVVKASNVSWSVILLTEFHIASRELPVWFSIKSFPHHQQFILIIHYKGTNSYHIVGIPEDEQPLVNQWLVNNGIILSSRSDSQYSYTFSLNLET